MTQRLSGNHWPAYADTSHYTRFAAAGHGWWAANDDVAVVFTEFIERFVREVEPIEGPVRDDWSYANRLVRGSTKTISNHGSATAIDLNALKHPRGARHTFSTNQRHTLRQIKNSLTDSHGVPVLRLGMDFTTVVDDMHVEINANAARVKQAANKIRKKNRHQEETMTAAPTAKEIAAAVWAHARKLTAADAIALGGQAEEGDETSANALLRFSPAVARLRREQAAQLAALNRTLALVVGVLSTGGTLTEAQITEAAEAGARRALEGLGRDLLNEGE